MDVVHDHSSYLFVNGRGNAHTQINKCTLFNIRILQIYGDIWRYLQIKKCYYRLLTFSESSADSEQHLTTPEVRGQPLMSLYGAAYTSAPRGDVSRT